MKSEFKTTKLLLGVLYAGIAVAVLVTAIPATDTKNGPTLKVSLHGVEIVASIADKPSLQERGLSGHKPLAPDEGMIFIFPEAGNAGFWMKDMLFPLDIIWFDENSRLIDVWENATPESYPQIHTPVTPSKYVLEVPAGFFEKHHVQKGDQLLFLPR